MSRVIAIAALCLLIGACSLFRDDGDVVQDSETGIRISIGYDAAVRDQHPERLAAEHCAGEGGKAAVWYGHDRDGNLHYKCE